MSMSRSRWWGAAGLALLLAHAPAPAQADRVRVHVEGVSGDLRRNVLARLTIQRTDGAVSEGTIRHLVERAPKEIDEALQPFGFYRSSVRSNLTRDGDQWTARLEIDPGPVVKVDTVDVRVLGPGERDAAFRRIVNRFPLRVGDPLHHDDYLRGKEALVRRGTTAGYLDARFDVAEVRVDLDRYAAAVHLHYETGPRFRFGDVNIEQDILDPELAHDFIHIRRGDPFDYGRLLQTQEDLLASPYWKGAEITPRRDLAESLDVPIDVKLTPHEPRRLLWALGYGTDDGVAATMGFEMRRLNRSGHRLGFDGQYGQIGRSATVHYHIPWANPVTDEIAFAVGGADERPVTSVTQRVFAATTLRRQLGDWTRTLGLAYEIHRFPFGAGDRTSRFLAPSVVWTFLRTDSRVVPAWGSRLDLDVRGASKQVLSNASFLRADARAKWISTPVHRTRLLLRGEVGTTWAPDFAPLSPSLRFFAGGGQSVRGFAYRSLGPRDSTGAVIGGPHLIVGSLEVDRRVLRNWLVAAFYDIGSALFRRGDPVEDAAGVGLRWISPLGPIRLDFATPLHEPGRKVHLHVGMGPDL